MIDSYVQLAVDGAGKQVDMDQVSTAASTTAYRQKAVLVGVTLEQFEEMLKLLRRQTLLLMQISMCLTQDAVSPVDGPEFDLVGHEDSE